jgi:ABC-type transport system involved in multi-copper enzyme maturation permease subunit
MIAAIRSEWILLNRTRLWAVLGAITVAFTVMATWLLIETAEPARIQGADGISLEAIQGAGGATTAVVSSMVFSSVLVLAAFISSTANEFTRGTLRVAFTRAPRRLTLLTGKVAARMGVAVVVMTVALAIGWVTAVLVAPGAGVDTTDWVSSAALRSALEDFVRLVFFVVVYAVLGTMIAVLVRSTPLALAVGLVWFGPIENVIGEGQSWAQRWFPGLLLRSVLRPDAPTSIDTSTALVTLAVYLAAAIAVTATVISRRDMTS